MKKTMLTAVLLLAIGFTAAWANDDEWISQKNAAGAASRPAVSSLSTSGLSASSPSAPGLSAAGHAKVRNILSSQLPPALFENIRQDYKNYWISELYEEGRNKNPTYCITIENADQVIKMSSDDSKSWVITSTVIKTSW